MSLRTYTKQISEDEQRPNDEVMRILGDASDFSGLAVELLQAKKPERAEEAIMKAMAKIEEAKTRLNGGE